jgi:SPP1 family predicted phage head-tail adaptor
MPRIESTRYDRKITILRPMRVREDAYGTTEVVWVALATVWAEVQDMLPSRAERIAEGLEIGRRPCRVIIRFREDVTMDMRLEYRGRTLRIAALAERGRRDALELTAEELTTEGMQP